MSPLFDFVCEKRKKGEGRGGEEKWWYDDKFKALVEKGRRGQQGGGAGRENKNIGVPSILLSLIMNSGTSCMRAVLRVLSYVVRRHTGHGGVPLSLVVEQHTVGSRFVSWECEQKSTHHYAKNTFAARGQTKIQLDD